MLKVISPPLWFVKRTPRKNQEKNAHTANCIKRYYISEMIQRIVDDKLPVFFCNKRN